MSRTYGSRACIVCGTLVSNAGAAFASHMRMHERNGEVVITTKLWVRSVRHRASKIRGLKYYTRKAYELPHAGAVKEDES